MKFSNNIFVNIFIWGFFLSLILMLFISIYFNTHYTIYKNPKDYMKIYKQITQPEKISHFPKIIPNNASHIKLYGYSDMPYNGEILMLEFKTDKSYIENALITQEFINKNDLIGTKQKIYYMPEKGFNTKNYTYYVIKNSDNLNLSKDYFPYFSGIGVDMKTNRILYYFISPSD